MLETPITSKRQPHQKKKGLAPDAARRSAVAGCATTLLSVSLSFDVPVLVRVMALPIPGLWTLERV